MAAGIRFNGLKRRSARLIQACIETLESRLFLSSAPAPLLSFSALKPLTSPSLPAPSAMFAQLKGRAHLNIALAGPDGVASPGTGYFEPSQIETAYGISSISFSGITGNGAGQTIAIVDPYDDPDFVRSTSTGWSTSDLYNFDSTLGIANSGFTFTKVNETGGTSYPVTDPNGPNSMNGNWEIEEALDVEWAHAMAPGANILLVEASSPSDQDLYTAVNWARQQPGVSVVSLSWGLEGKVGGVTVPVEVGSETSSGWDGILQTPANHTGVTFVAAAGDLGSPAQTPSASPYVVSVGGTTLTVGAGNAWSSEVVWNSPDGKTGGGPSAYETEPSYQTNVVPSGMSGGYRATPDVAFDAGGGTSLSSEVWIYDSYNTQYGGNTGYWYGIGGTSLGTPCWAAMIAIANQGRAINGLSPLIGSSQTLPALYTAPSTDFHDITSGMNNSYSAATGYDLVSGRGSPIANSLIYDLSSPIQNAGFESGSLAPWTSYGSVTVTSGMSHSGTYSVKLKPSSGTSGVNETIGVTPNTTYLLSAYAKVTSATSDAVEIDAADYSGGTGNVSTTINSTSWTQGSVTFTTGPTSTTAVVNLNDAATSGTDPVYGDDFTVTQVATVQNAGFETGSLSPWTTYGSATVTSGTSNSGAYSAKLNSPWF